MSLYPSLEDMKVDQMCRAQVTQLSQQLQQPQQHESPPPYPTGYSGAMPVPYGQGNTQNQVKYPALGDFMGMELSEAVIMENLPEYSSRALVQQQTALIPQSSANNQVVAPVSGQSLGMYRAQVTHGIRELILCKDKDGKVGLRVKEINKGIFVCLVIENSPAALVGIRFGDQILQVNDKNVAGYSMEKVHDLLRKSPTNGIKIVVRDRPFERTITLHKDSVGSIGFQFKNGQIVSIVKDSSAARNGVLTDHQLLEVDGQNVVGLKDKETRNMIDKAEGVVTITIMPSFLYDHMVKKMSGSLIKNLMDHTIPAI